MLYVKDLNDEEEGPKSESRPLIINDEDLGEEVVPVVDGIDDDPLASVLSEESEEDHEIEMDTYDDRD